MELEQESLDDLRARVDALEAANAGLLARKPELQRELEKVKRKEEAAKSPELLMRRIFPRALLGCCLFAGGVGGFLAFSGGEAGEGPGFRVAGVANATLVGGSDAEEVRCEVTIASMERPMCDFFATCGSEFHHFRDNCPEIGVSEIHFSREDTQLDLRVTQVSWQAQR